jgi:hypothetical protein
MCWDIDAGRRSAAFLSLRLACVEGAVALMQAAMIHQINRMKSGKQISY